MCSCARGGGALVVGFGGALRCAVLAQRISVNMRIWTGEWRVQRCAQLCRDSNAYKKLEVTGIPQGSRGLSPLPYGDAREMPSLITCFGSSSGSSCPANFLPFKFTMYTVDIYVRSGHVRAIRDFTAKITTTLLIRSGLDELPALPSNQSPDTHIHG